MPACPVCNTCTDDSCFIETHTATFGGVARDYKLYRCPSCDLDYWEPREVMREFYEGEGEVGYKYFHLGLGALQVWHKPFFNAFPFRQGKLLDIGCGDGSFLLKAQQCGFDVWGIDLDSKSVAAAQKKGLHRTFAMSLDAFSAYASNQGWKFDVITFFEVLEHQENPLSFLNCIKRLLKPGGWIAGSVPNGKRFWKRYDVHSRMRYDTPPNHFLHFSKNSLKYIFNKAGFYDIKTREAKSIRKLIETFESCFSQASGLFRLRMSFIENRLGVQDDIVIAIKTKQTFHHGFYIFKTLQTLRDILLLPSVIVMYHLLDGNNIYFQAHL